MRIVIVGGKNKADFLIRSLLKNDHEVLVINDDPNFSKYLAKTHHLSVYCGDPRKKYVLEEAEIDRFDILISLMIKDEDNLAICQMAKHFFHIKRTVAVVSNPKSVAILKRLGVNIAISATYMIANYIERASTIQNLISSMTIEDDAIVLNEIILDADSPVIGHSISDIPFEEDAIISAILRNQQLVIPRGKTVLQPNDKLIILSTPKNQQKVCNHFIAKDVSHDA